jgi:hypothetical protein
MAKDPPDLTGGGLLEYRPTIVIGKIDSENSAERIVSECAGELRDIFRGLPGRIYCGVPSSRSSSSV